MAHSTHSITNFDQQRPTNYLSDNKVTDAVTLSLDHQTHVRSTSCIECLNPYLGLWVDILSILLLYRYNFTKFRTRNSSLSVLFMTTVEYVVCKSLQHLFSIHFDMCCSLSSSNELLMNMSLHLQSPTHPVNYTGSWIISGI